MNWIHTFNWTSHPFLLILIGLLTVFVLVQLVYILFVFTKLATYRSAKNETKTSPSVSVIVCAHNELENLRELLPLLDAQNYLDFEVIIVNDRSTDDTEAWLNAEGQQWKNLRFIHINQQYDHVTPKKYALTTAIWQAKNGVILLTDADCRPVSKQWIGLMAGELTDEKKIVLGFSPYYKQSGFLNRFIRFETFYVAVQYLSLALARKPYMGVGRNLLYDKTLFVENKGFYSHLNVLGGDDDLLMNEMATSTNSTVCLNPDSFMYSQPKTTWAEWFVQKKRHLSVSKHYRFDHKMRLGLLSGSQVLVWLFFVPAVVCAIFLFPQEPIYLLLITSIFGLRLLLQWLVLGLNSRKLGNSVGWFAIPFFDFVLFLYYIGMAVVMWVNRRKKTQWK